MDELIEEAEKMALELIAFNDCRFNMDASRIIQELAERLRLQSEVVEAAKKHVRVVQSPHTKFCDIAPVDKKLKESVEALAKLPTGKE